MPVGAELVYQTGSRPCLGSIADVRLNVAFGDAAEGGGDVSADAGGASGQPSGGASIFPETPLTGPPQFGFEYATLWQMVISDG